MADLKDLVCAACLEHLGRVYEWQAAHLGELHAEKCTASPEQHAKALVDVQFAEMTGDTTALTRRLA
jgi:hypothetical protein